MNHRINIKPAILAFLLPVAAQADLFITNFDTINAPSSANGVWKNSTTETDLTIPVSLTQTGGVVTADNGSSTSSTIDDDFPWLDVPDFPPFISGIDSFNPNYYGDYINIEVLGGDTSMVTIHFNAQIVDPVLNFTDVDLQTTMVFTDSFIIDGQSGNIVPSTTSVHPDGTDAGAPFDQECAGSLHFSGTFTQLTFTINNAGSDGDDDRTGFSVSTTTEPVPLAGPDVPMLSITNSAPGEVSISWTPETPGLILQVTTNITSNVWVNASSGSTNPAVSSPIEQSQFYRVISP